MHPVITDIPLGAWTAATACDIYELATGDERLAPGADAAVSLGLLGAAGAIVTGINDWKYTGDKPRRVGALHALINIGATACYIGSWWQRRQGCRRAGLATGLTGYALSLAGAYLGGHLVYNERVGINHAPEALPENFVPLMKEADLPENKICKADAAGIPVFVVKRGGRIHVLAEECSHLGAPLSDGDLAGNIVTCPWHKSQFSIEDGHVVRGPATYLQPCFEVRVREGQIEARAPRGMVPNSY